jgi:CheY-like chemotaxis protein
MVYGIVTQNGGTIEVESAPGQGTAFKIGIPAVEASEEAVEAQPPVAAASGGTETILLAEDESIVRRFIYSVLTQRGYRILEAATGDEAARCSSEYQGTIDLLLTDVVMPGMNGAQLAERIAAARPVIKVLFMSGYTEDAVFNDRLRCGAEFLQKPMTPDVLLAKVRQLLDAPLEGPR